MRRMPQVRPKDVMTNEGVRLIQNRALNKARELLQAKGYKSRDFFSDVHYTGANNVRQRRTEIEEGEDQPYAQPEVCAMVWNIDGWKNYDQRDLSDGLHGWEERDLRQGVRQES
jgi:hypothetical protein